MHLSSRRPTCLTFAVLLLAVLCLLNWPIYHNYVAGGFPPIMYFGITAGLAITLLWSGFSDISAITQSAFPRWAIFYFFSGLILIVLMGDLNKETGFWRSTLSILVFFSWIILFSAVNMFWIGRAFFIAACVTTLTVWHDLLFPYFYLPQDSPLSNPGRGAGLFLNANMAANAIIVTSIAAVAFIKKHNRIWIMPLLVFGVFPTLSRGGLTTAFMVALLIPLLGLTSNRKLLFRLAIAAPFVIVVIKTLLNRSIETASYETSNILGRINFVLGRNLALLEDEGRYFYIFEAISLWKKFPFFGAGIGITESPNKFWPYTQGTHNLYLKLLAEQGAIGLLVFLSFLGIIFWMGYRLYKNNTSIPLKDIGRALLLLGSYFTVVSFFSHNLMNDLPSLMALGSLVAAAGNLSHRPQTWPLVKKSAL